MSEFLGIDIKTMDDGGFHFCQTGLIRKVLEDTGMEHCNGLLTPTKVEAPLVTDANGSEAKKDWPNLCASVIGIILYLESNTRPDISFAIQQCAWLHQGITIDSCEEDMAVFPSYPGQCSSV